MAELDIQNQQITQSTVQQMPEQSFVASKIEIDTVTAIIGFATTLLAIGVAWGTLKTNVKNIGDALKSDIIPDLKDVQRKISDVERKFTVVEDRVDTLWKDKFAPAHSPRQLNDRGEDILKKSGIKEIVDDKRAFLLELVKKQGLTNAYDAENTIEKIMFDLPKHCPDVLDKLKDGAFKTGTEFSAILFIGSIYLRNLIFPELGFSVEDLDKPKK